MVVGVMGQVDYGVDVSFPMHHEKVSTNYDWLSHNVYDDVPTPKEFRDMPLQPLGDRQAIYDHMIKGCVEYYGDKGYRCLEYEKDRVAMSLRQPQSMQVSTTYIYACAFAGLALTCVVVVVIVCIELHQDWFCQNQDTPQVVGPFGGFLGQEQGQPITRALANRELVHQSLAFTHTHCQY